MGRQFGFLAISALIAAACGGSDSAGPQPLEADPAVATGCLTEAPGAGQVRAKWIACEDELPAGRLVSGREGDILLENDRVKIVVRGFGEGYYLMGTSPGGIVDAARHGADDQLKEILPIFALNGGAFDEIVIIEAGDDGPAEVVVRGPLAPVPFVSAAIVTEQVAAIAEHHYLLEADSDTLLIRSYLFGVDGSSGTIEVGDALFAGGVISSWAPGRGLLEGTATVPFVASTGGSGTSYGLVYAPDSADTMRFADIANVKLALGPGRSLGNPAPVDRYLVIGDGSVASVTERAWALRGDDTGTVTGTTSAGIDVEVSDAGGAAITRARADASGNYRVALPAGSYQLAAGSPGHAPGTPVMTTVTAGSDASVDLTAGGTGTLDVTVTDGDDGAIPARVVVRAADFERRIEYAGPDGRLRLPLPPGDYTVDVSRGVEYTAFTADPLTITAGADTALAAQLDRVVDTSGWIAVDTHIHSEMSTDSQVPLDVRLLSIAAEGVEVPISTDHDFVTDYGPVAAELGLEAFIAPQIGVETSSLVWGHVNTWGLTPDYDRGGGHAIPWYGAAPGDVYELMRARGDQVVIQVNHPESGSSGLFDIIDFNPETAMADRDPEDLDLPASTNLSDFDFDAIEVANDFNRDDFEASFADWLGLVAVGHPAVATGSSDSHDRRAYIGNSRTYVYVGAGADDPATIDVDAVNDALRAGKVVVSQGAFVVAAIVDPGTTQPAAPGAVVDLTGHSDATLSIRVQAPPWMPLARIVIYGGRQPARTIELDSGDTQVVRYDGEVTMPIGNQDGFFVIRVEPAGAGAPVLGTPDASFTNPLRFSAGN